MGIHVRHADGRCVPLSREALERMVLIGRELARRKPWVPIPDRNGVPHPQRMAYESQADITGYGGAAGGGKGLALDTELPTPTGWTTMGAVAEGDWLLDEHGLPCRVTATSGISHRPCYRLTFDDSASLVADDVHRWLTFDAKELAALTRTDPEWRAKRRANRPARGAGKRPDLALRNAASSAAGRPAPQGSIRDTQAIAVTLTTATGRRNHAIRVQGALALPHADLPLDPYVLGVWLGDGSARNSYITGIDVELLDNLRALGETVETSDKDPQRHLVRGLKVRLRAMGLLENKHVPGAYLRGSYDQRLALLQGLMDTDGHAALDGGCEFDNTNRRLVDAAHELVVSLGLKATITEGRAKLNGKDCGPRWRVKFATDLPVFRLTRKLARLKPCRRTTNFRYITACEPVASVPTKCIAVDSPSRLYLAGRNMVPTHNTDLACGLALTQHRKILMLRRVGTELLGIEDRLEDLIGNKDGYNGQKKVWKRQRIDYLPGADGKAVPKATKQQIEFASLPNLGDERGFQGRPHDLIVYDEAANFLEAQVRFLLGWLRTTVKGQRCRALLCFNPPTSSEGRWIIEFFAPWLDPKHPNPAKQGELRWFGTVAGKDYPVDDGRRFILVDGHPSYDYDPKDYEGDREALIIQPTSRTFIASRVTDNPHLMGTGYMAQLQALPEPLRSQMLNGDFLAGMSDSIWQVIPTAWVEAAMARWKPKDVKPPMDSVGVDVARGKEDGNSNGDETSIARRHGRWYDEMLVYPGKETPSGNETAALALLARRDMAPIHIDVIGVGASPYDILRNQRQQVIGVDVREKALGMDRSGRLRFLNQRSELWWKFREGLDPDNNMGWALPPDPRLKADLCAPTWTPQGSTIVVESREAIIKRIGRSPDRGSAIVLAQLDTPKIDVVRAAMGAKGRDYDPYAR